jgi:hypothetical protein
MSKMGVRLCRGVLRNLKAYLASRFYPQNNTSLAITPEQGIYQRFYKSVTKRTPTFGKVSQLRKFRGCVALDVFVFRLLRYDPNK